MTTKKEFFTKLRTANVERDKEWSESDKTAFTAEFFANGMFGEGGEASNILKKLHREAMGKTGSRAVVDALAEELADVVIYNDLLAWVLKFEFNKPLPEWPTVDNPKWSKLGIGLGARIGRTCGLIENAIDVKKLSVNLMRDVQFGIMCHCKFISDQLGLPFYDNVARKFNMTSRKYGMTTMLIL